MRLEKINKLSKLIKIKQIHFSIFVFRSDLKTQK